MARFLSEQEIDQILNESEGDLSTSEDEEVFSPAEVDEGAAILDAEEDVEDTVQQTEAHTSGTFWLSKQMNPRGPNMTEDILHPQGTSNDSCLYSFFAYFDLDFWKLVAEQTNLYSAQQRELKSVKTNYVEMVNFAGIQIMMGTLNFPQARLYWRRDLSVPAYARQ